MAAYRLGIKTVIIPEDNISDLDEIDEKIKSELEFIPVNNFDQVLDIALENRKRTASRTAKSQKKAAMLIEDIPVVIPKA